VRHPQIFILRLAIEWEWQRVGAVQNAQFSGNDFNVARGEIWILRARQTCGDRA
jgi:hypothetical protein